MAEVDETLKKKRTFRKFTFRGVDLDQLLDMPNEQLMELMHARARRRFARGLKRKPMALVKKLRRAKKEAPPNEKPEIVKTHPQLDNMSRIILLVACVQVCLIQTALCGLPCGCSKISSGSSGYLKLGGVEKVIEKYSISAPSCSSSISYSAPSVSLTPSCVSAPNVNYGKSSISYGGSSYGGSSYGGSSYGGSSYGGSGYSSSSGSYGGSGTGVVSSSGDIGAYGETAVVGSVPVLGSVTFSGKLPAKGSVSITGQCGCGCKA